MIVERRPTIGSLAWEAAKPSASAEPMTIYKRTLAGQLLGLY